MRRKYKVEPVNTPEDLRQFEMGNKKNSCWE